MATHRARAPLPPGKSFHSALGDTPLGNVDLDTLERLEQSYELDYYLDPAAPGILYTLVQTHIKNKPGRKIFDDQYGLLCVKVLIRLVQVLACAHSNTLGHFKDTLDAEFVTVNILGLLSNHTVAQVAGSGYNQPTGDAKTVAVLLEKTKGLFTYEVLIELLSILWRDRKRFFVLCESGSLPGVALLLYMLWEQINNQGAIEDRILVSRLRDLLFRCYLVNPSEDQRGAMRLLCVHLYQLHDAHEEDSEPYDTQDSQAIISAYGKSLEFVTADSDRKSGIKLDMYRYLLEFVSDLSEAPSIGHENLYLIVKTATERLWMAFDCEKWDYVVPPSDPRSQVMYYMGDLAYALNHTLLKVQKSRQPPKRILEGLVQSDFPNLLARYMFLCFRTRVFSEYTTYSMRQIPSLLTLVLGFMPVSHEVFADTYSDWLKALSHFRLLHGSCPPGDKIISHVMEALGTWVRWGHAVGFIELRPSPQGNMLANVTDLLYKVDCTNPSFKCQRDDWTSSYSDSHSRHCQAKKLPNV